MSKKKNKIPKNRDIEELVAHEDGSEQIKDMQDVINEIDNKEELRKRIKVEQLTAQELDEKVKEEISRKVENYNRRKDAESAEEKRRIALLKAMNKIEEEKEER